MSLCADRNRIFANRLHITIEYTFDLAVRNVERLNVSCFVMGVAVILFGHFYRLIWESFPIQKWSLFSQFYVF